jgi:hypothetical protein
LASNNDVISLVAASRRTLPELLLAEDSESSLFWGIFTTTTALGVFSEEDRNSALAHCSGFDFEDGAKTELLNWTGGFPLFYLALLNFVIQKNDVGTVSNETINLAAEEELKFFAPFIDRLLNDLPPDCRERCHYLLLNGVLAQNDMPRQERDKLCSIGFARVGARKVSGSCRLARRHLQEIGVPSTNISHIFGRSELYDQNVKQFLELRLSQISDFDPRLRRRIENSIRDLPDFPAESLGKIRSISDRVFELIWDHEFGPEKRIPLAIIEYWNSERRGITDFLHEAKIPEDLGRQCRLLQLLVGAENRISPRASSVAKSTYYLLEAVQGFGDYGQHPHGAVISVGTAAAAVLSCIELAACLERELL